MRIILATIAFIMLATPSWSGSTVEKGFVPIKELPNGIGLVCSPKGSNTLEKKFIFIYEDKNYGGFNYWNENEGAGIYIDKLITNISSIYLDGGRVLLSRESLEFKTYSHIYKCEIKKMHIFKRDINNHYQKLIDQNKI